MSPFQFPGSVRVLLVPALKLSALLVTAFLLSWHSLSDLDIWFHLRAGRDLLEGAGMLRANTLSFTQPGHPWMNHEWLFQVLVAPFGPALDRAALDVTSWNLLRTGLVLVMTAGLIWNDLRCPRTRNQSWLALPTVVGLFLIWPRMTLRPELVSYILLVMVFPLIERVTLNGAHDKDDSTRKLPLNRTGFKILAITWIWAQFHGFASLVPVLVLVGWLTGTIQARSRPAHRNPIDPGPDHRQLVKLVPLLLVALTATPNGWRGLVFPLRALGQFRGEGSDLQNTVAELVPLLDTPNALYFTKWVFLASLIWCAGWIITTWARTSLFRMTFCLLAAVAALMNQRSIGIYGLAFVLLHQGYHGFHLPLRVKSAVTGRIHLGKAGTALSLLFLLAVPLFLWPALVSNRFYLGEGADRRYGAGLTPGRFANELAPRLRSAPPGRFFANLDCAGYLLGTTPHSVYIDGRTEAYPVELWREYRQVKDAGARALDLLDQRRMDGVCLTIAGGAFDSLNRTLIGSARWDLVDADEALLWFRPDSRDPVPGADATGHEAKSRMLELVARRLLERAAKPEPDPTRRADLCLSAAIQADLAGLSDLQKTALEQGLKMRPDHPVLNHNLGNLLMARRDWNGALRHFVAALNRNRALAGTALNAGVCQMRLGEVDEAIDSFKRSIRIQENQFGAWANLGLAYLQNGDKEKGARALERALALNPDDTRLRKVLQDLR